MSYQATIYKVMIASPGDVKDERNAVESALADWNHDFSSQYDIAFMPLRWEKDGTPTGNGEPSGTVEEINYHLNAGKPVMLYFCNRPIDYMHFSEEEKQQVDALMNYQKDIKDNHKGLYDDYSDSEELKSKIIRQLRTYVEKEEPFVSDRKALVDGADSVPNKRNREIQPVFKISMIKDQALRTEVFRKADLFNGTLKLPTHSNIQFTFENDGKFAITNVEAFGHVAAATVAPGDSAKLIVAYQGSPDAKLPEVNELNVTDFPKDDSGYPSKFTISFIDANGEKQEQLYVLQCEGEKFFYKRIYKYTMPNWETVK